MKKYVLSLDLGTTSIRAILFDQESNICGIEQKEFTQYFPEIGWVEQDAQEIWQTLQTVVGALIVNKNLDLNDVECIGIANQRETTVLWDKETGLPVYHAIVWQSNQSANICEEMIEKGYEKIVKAKTGLPINPYFSATKVRWILDEIEGIEEKIKQNNICFGTIDSWILWKLTGGVHATDYSNASRTMLFNIFDLQWDEDILKMLNISKNILPKVCESSHYYGHTSASQFYGYKIPIMALAGDQQAALFGHCCFEPGIIKNTYGTGCFMLMNTKSKPIISEHGLLTTIAWGMDSKVEYALEGSIFVAGSAVQWLRDSLKIINQASDSERYAMKLKDNHGVYVVPAFVGLGSPYWDNEAKGAIFGLTRASGKAEVIRATLESICYQTRDVLEVMIHDCDCKLKKLRVDGGAVENQFLMQFQADILGVEVDVSNESETTALGVAYLAGLKSGFWQSKQEILQYRRIKQNYKPKMSKELKEINYNNWKKAVKATMNFK